MTQLVEELPHLKANCRDGSWWCLPVASQESFLNAWMGGRSFWSGLGSYGATVHIKLADITGAVEQTVESLARGKEEADEKGRREKEADVLGDA